MNSKFNFLNNELKNSKDFMLQHQNNMTDSIADVQKSMKKYFSLKNELGNKWDELTKNKEYHIEYKDDNNAIVTKQGTTLATFNCNKEIAESIADLMNLAYLEGARRIIDVFKDVC